MADKGIIITNMDGGLSIACRDGVAPDEGSNARVIQRSIQTQCQIPSPLGTPTRAAVTTVDGDDISAFPAEVLANAVDCTDKTGLVLYGVFHGGSTASTVETALVGYDSEASVICLSSSETLQDGDFLLTYNGGAESITKACIFDDVPGLSKASLAIRYLTLDIATSVDLWLFAI